jgi:hypothetical protein
VQKAASGRPFSFGAVASAVGAAVSREYYVVEKNRDQRTSYSRAWPAPTAANSRSNTLGREVAGPEAQLITRLRECDIVDAGGSRRVHHRHEGFIRRALISLYDDGCARFLGLQSFEVGPQGAKVN